jgi:serine O-acetyltransferase
MSTGTATSAGVSALVFDADGSAVPAETADENAPRPRASILTPAHTPDWSREKKGMLEWSPPRALLASIRAYQRHAASATPWAGLARRLCVLRHRFWSVITGADIPLNSHLGGGLLMIHANGVVIHPRATIGPNCMIFQQVTIGTAKSEDVPTLGAHVEIGAGARILGNVVIGDHAKIGANAVVLQDVPAGATAVGVPARIVSAAGSRDAGRASYRPDNHLQTAKGSR